MKTFGILRIKNEARWIDRVVASMLPVCDMVIVLDDHSTDGTAEICERLGCVVYRSHFEGVHEARDKDWLLEQVWAHGAELGDCVLCIDGDEILHPDDYPEVRRFVSDPRRLAPVACSMRVLYLWDSETRYRVDGVFGKFARPSMFRLDKRHLSFRRTEFGGSLHCSSVPAAHIRRFSRKYGIRLLHLGYLKREDRIRKYHWYNSIDPKNRYEDCYRHMVIGDLFPAESRFVWGGPIEFAELPAYSIPAPGAAADGLPLAA